MPLAEAVPAHGVAGGLRTPGRPGARRALRAARRRPETERWSPYFEAELATQFDDVIHFDHTRALEPLELTSEWEDPELPETYPFAV